MANQAAGYEAPTGVHDGRDLPAARQEDSPESVEGIWAAAVQVAIVGIFVITLGACLFFCRPVLLPVTAALVVGMTLAPLVKTASRHRIPPWLTASFLAVALLAVSAAAVTFLGKPFTDWIARAPEIGALIREKLYVLDRPLAALRELQEALLPAGGATVATVATESSRLAVVTPLVAFLTPAVLELVLFSVTLIFFLAAQMDFRRYVVSFFSTRQEKLHFIRIANDIEQQLVSYLVTVTVINFCLGVAVSVGAYAFGFPSPVLFGILAMVLNYIPYIGAGCMTLILFGVGLVSFPSLGYAIIPPAAFVALATLEGQFITPTVLGRRLTLNPLAVLLALAFWAWIWGPMGAFLAVPLMIVGLVTLHHLFPADESRLPG
jgi:predicted PurR-regulated permease PerM